MRCILSLMTPWEAATSQFGPVRVTLLSEMKTTGCAMRRAEQQKIQKTLNTSTVLSSNSLIKFAVLSSQIHSNCFATDGSNGLLILTLCWTYIFSVRLLEIQNRRVMFSPNIPKPINANEAARARKAGSVVLNLTGYTVPYQMIMWLRTILAPKPAWYPADKRGFPPWMSSCPKDVHFAFLADKEYIEYEKTEFRGNINVLPNSIEAVELLI